jgi:hypothetical protein
MGTIGESDRRVLLALRLRVELGRITEIETDTYRDNGDGRTGIAELDAAGGPEAPWFETIPVSERPSRQEMIALANTYFDAVEGGGARGLYGVAVDCSRVENGVADLPCLDRFDDGYSLMVTRIHNRRFPLVDEERGVVWGYAVFDHDGTGAVSQATLGDGGTVSTDGFARPSSVQMTAAVSIRGRLIQEMEILSSEAPYHANSPWEGGLGGR